MYQLLHQLKQLDRQILIGIVGIGSIGRGMVLQAHLTPNIECVTIADLHVDKAIAAAELFNRPYEVAESVDGMDDIIRKGKLAVCSDGDLIATCELLDVFVEATSSIVGGGKYGITALNHGNHLVMMNYEADLMFGSYLMNLAEEKNLIYTVCDGDQPAVLRRMIEEMEFMQFKLVMAGNMKGFHDRYSNPTKIIPEADKRDLDYKMCTSYTDGSKLCVEMAVLANGINGYVSRPGMIGPSIASIYDVFDVYEFQSIWDGRHPLVDYVLGARPSGGVFAIGYSDHPYQQSTLAWLPPNMGPGPFYLFYRPYHLCHFESMATIAEAIVNRRPVLKPDYGFRTNVYAYAKKDLQKGDLLDGMGGYACYGLIENSSENKSRPGIPICLAEDVELKRDIPKDGKIYLDDVDCAGNEEGFRLFNLSLEAASKTAA